MTRIGEVTDTKVYSYISGSKNIQSNNSIFSDKNNNDIVDKNDFDDEETAKLAFQKGLIGRRWKAVKGFINDILKFNKEEKGIIKEKRYNEKSNEYYTATIKNGKEISRTYFKADGKTIDEIINLEYDNQGNISGKVSIDGEGNLRFYNEIVNNEIVRQLQYNIDGTVDKEYKYSKGKVTEGTQFKPYYTHHVTFDSNEKVSEEKVTYIGEKVKYTNDNKPEFAKFLYVLYNELPKDVAGLKELDNVIKELFGDNLKYINHYRGGIGIDLKDGTEIEYDDGYSFTNKTNKPMVIYKKNGTEEQYNKDGELVK